MTLSTGMVHFGHKLANQQSMYYTIWNFSCYINVVQCDVVPIDICQVISGSPFLYDRDAQFHQKAQEYELTKDNERFIVVKDNHIDASKLVTINQAKQIVSACQKYMLIMICSVSQDIGDFSTLTFLVGSMMKNWQALASLLKEYAELFKEAHGLPPKQPWSMTSNSFPMHHYRTIACTITRCWRTWR